MNRFSQQLPLLARLYDRFLIDDRRNFFHRFPERLLHQATFDYYQRLERALACIPLSQWPAFESKVRKTVSAYVDFRFWSALHEVFNEAMGFEVLKEEYSCEEIAYVSTGVLPAPDLRGSREGQIYYLEVKTVNHTEQERLSWYGIRAVTDLTDLPEVTQRKISEAYQAACSQLDGPPDSQLATKIAFVVLDLDYFVDPIVESRVSVVERYLSSIERKDYPIRCVVR